MIYQHTQIGYFIIIVIGAVSLMIAGANYDLESTGMDTTVLWAVLGLLAFLFANFFSLTVRIDEKKLSWSYGVGLLNFSVPLEEIQQAIPVRTSFMDGLGIRYRPGKGWIYNVSGFHAVEITRTGGSKIQIGTDEPDILADTLQRVAGLRGG